MPNFLRFLQVTKFQIREFLTRVVLFICVQTGIGLTFEKKNEGEVLMGNDVACKVVGIGTVKVKMYADIIHTFGNV